MGRTTGILTLLLLVCALGCEPGELVAPTIDTHPTHKTANAGQIVTLQVAASGSAKLRYQWTRGGVDIPGASYSFYMSPELTLADDGALYACRVTNKEGSVTSGSAVVSVHDAVTISLHRIKAADGWTLGVKRYLPSAAIASYEPVVMTHGFLESHDVYDLDSTHSLAMSVALAGFDVWVLDLRGNGLSAGPKISELLSWSFNIDDFIHKDAPAVIDHVLTLTGKSQVFWVGHSMGGLVGYAYVETESKHKIKGLVTLAGAAWMGGPAQFDSKPGGFFMALGSALGPFLLPDFPVPVGYAWKKGATGKPWAKALHGGVTTALATPLDRNVIGGLGLALKTGGAPVLVHPGLAANEPVPAADAVDHHRRGRDQPGTVGVPLPPPLPHGRRDDVDLRLPGLMTARKCER